MPARSPKPRTSSKVSLRSSRARTQGDPSEPRIHDRGDSRLDRVLEFAAFVAGPLPLAVLLDEVPRQIAAIIGAQVASLYLLEGEGDALVMRGTVGFPSAARGKVRLAVGEGLTGLAVQCRRPISVVGAPTHAQYRRFPELGEDQFPVLLAVPVLGHRGPLGALVLQRAGDQAFKSSEVNLAVALTTPMAAGLRHAELLDDVRERKQARRSGGGTRKVTLPGRPVVPGRALGAIAALRRPATSPSSRAGAEDAKLLQGAFDVAEKALTALVTRAVNLGLAKDSSFLTSYLVIVSDGRLRQRAFELLEQQRGLAHALGEVAREAARVAEGVVGDPFLRDRARDIEDLCDALVMLASPDARAELPAKAVLLGDQLSVFDLLVSARAQPVAIALSEHAVTPRTHVLLQLLGIPAIVDVANALRWAAPGDVAILDADHGLLVVNPSRADVAAVRAARRAKRLAKGESSARDDDDDADDRAD